MQWVSVPKAWMVAAVAAAAGAGVGAGGAVLQSLTLPWQVGGFRPGGIGDASRGPGGRPTGTVEAVETTYDFGIMQDGGSGAHDFVITNAGPGPLRLSRGASSCTCTIADFEAAGSGDQDGSDDAGTKVIPPGGSTTVTLRWKGRGPAGPFRQRATILTDDPRRPEIVFGIEGTLVPTWKAVPMPLLVPNLSVTAGGTATARVFTFGEGPPEVDRATVEHSDSDGRITVTTSPLAAAEIAAEPGATGGLLMTVEAPAGLPLGPLKALVVLTVRMPDEVTIEVPLEGSVTGDLSVVAASWDRSRQVLLLGTVSGRQGLRTQAFVMARGPHREAIQPTVREVVPESLRVTVGAAVPVGTGSVVRIPLEIVVPPDSRPANHLCSELGPAGRIVLDTGHPDTPTLTIPVCIAIGP